MSSLDTSRVKTLPNTQQFPLAQPLSQNPGAWERGMNLEGTRHLPVASSPENNILRPFFQIRLQAREMPVPIMSKCSANKQIHFSLTLIPSPSNFLSILSGTKQNMPEGMKYSSSELRGKLTGM
jgi:hypothetical protein